MTSLIPYSHRWRKVESVMNNLDPFLEDQLSPLTSLESLSRGSLGTEHNIVQLLPLLHGSITSIGSRATPIARQGMVQGNAYKREQMLRYLCFLSAADLGSDMCIRICLSGFQ